MVGGSRSPADSYRVRKKEGDVDLQLARTVFSDQSTIGELRVNGAFECFTLEDVVRTV